MLNNFHLKIFKDCFPKNSLYKYFILYLFDFNLVVNEIKLTKKNSNQLNDFKELIAHINLKFLLILPNKSQSFLFYR